MSFFHKKMSQNVWATIMPFGPVTNFLLAQKKNFGPALAGPHFRHCYMIICSLLVGCYATCNGYLIKPISRI